MALCVGERLFLGWRLGGHLLRIGLFVSIATIGRGGMPKLTEARRNQLLFIGYVFGAGTTFGTLVERIPPDTAPVYWVFQAFIYFWLSASIWPAYWLFTMFQHLSPAST